MKYLRLSVTKHTAKLSRDLVSMCLSTPSHWISTLEQSNKRDTTNSKGKIRKLLKLQSHRWTGKHINKSWPEFDQGLAGYGSVARQQAYHILRADKWGDISTSRAIMTGGSRLAGGWGLGLDMRWPLLDESRGLLRSRCGCVDADRIAIQSHFVSVSIGWGINKN